MIPSEGPPSRGPDRRLPSQLTLSSRYVCVCVCFALCVPVFLSFHAAFLVCLLSNPYRPTGVRMAFVLVCSLPLIALNRVSLCYLPCVASTLPCHLFSLSCSLVHSLSPSSFASTLVVSPSTAPLC